MQIHFPSSPFANDVGGYQGWRRFYFRRIWANTWLLSPYLPPCFPGDEYPTELQLVGELFGGSFGLDLGLNLGLNLGLVIKPGAKLYRFGDKKFNNYNRNRLIN